MPGWDFAHAWDEYLFILHMLKDTVSLDAAHQGRIQEDF